MLDSLSFLDDIQDGDAGDNLVIERKLQSAKKVWSSGLWLLNPDWSQLKRPSWSEEESQQGSMLWESLGNLEIT